MFHLNVDRSAAFVGTKKPNEPYVELLQILIVEDDDADAYLIRRLLGEDPRIGNVIRAVDGVEALEMLSVGIAPHLAFIDLHMPRMNGFSLVEEISAKNLKFPMIALTSSSSPPESIRSKLRGVQSIVSKPPTVSQMREVLGRSIDTVAA